MFSKLKALLSGKQSSEDIKTSSDYLKQTDREPVRKERPSVKTVKNEIKSSPGQAANNQPADVPAEEKKQPKRPEMADQDKKQGRDQKRGKKADRNDGGRDLYRFMNQALKTMHFAYSKGQFDEIKDLGKIPDRAVSEYDSSLKSLSEDCAAYLALLRSLIMLRKEEDAVYADIADRESLKKEFLQAMLPFYAAYAGKLYDGKVKYSSLIGSDMLKLFHELTGKRFSVGFHRRHESGINAFEWENDRYKVFDRKGHMLCDATFKDGHIENGYGEKTRRDPDHEEWNLVEAGQWKEGVFTGGSIRYEYIKKII